MTAKPIICAQHPAVAAPAGETCNAYHGTQRCRTDREREYHTNNNRNDDAHDKWLQLRRGIHEAAEHIHQIGNNRTGELCDRHTGKNGNNRSDKNVDLGCL